MGVIPGGTDCPAGTPVTSHCVGQAGAVLVKGLGKVQVVLVHVVDTTDTSCPRGTVTGDLTSPRGSLAVSGEAPACVNPTFGYASYQVRLDGSGRFAGATGTGTIGNNAGNYVVDATLTATTPTFDVTSPTITGAVDRTVRTGNPRGARVTFLVAARDDSDDSVPVTCSRRSGSLFRVGVTRVTCRATDSSANSAARSFSVVVKRR